MRPSIDDGAYVPLSECAQNMKQALRGSRGITFSTFHHIDLACVHKVGELNTNLANLLSLRFHI